ncbi:Protein N-acetyltransferase, RimJ/RimL family [Chitinophaga sp. CF118]|uniref:GNAT family N-acetyltransferase n=1 Tax=Chitinophaga sp. CF118 TaxID=1884367 RepID=UPI0008EA73B3|nr:GNAT family N-acetyltransferase [Chitinophaga sp. CF118]SFD25317.1 Protein N-acetyltransferase, RimJ/RimL family [Chitinophaga sp. CF118]
MQHFLPNGQSLEIRNAKPEDATAMLSYFRQLTKETGFLLFTLREAAELSVESEKDYILSFLDDKKDLLLVAMAEGKLVGSITIKQPGLWKQAHLGQLGIGILHSYWNMGIGRRLITAGIRWAEQHKDMEIIHLSVFSNNERAIQLYRNFGFAEYGRMPQGVRHQDGSYGDTILMSKRIKNL